MSACLTGTARCAAAQANVEDNATTASKATRSTSAPEQREAVTRMVGSKDDGASNNLQTEEREATVSFGFAPVRSQIHAIITGHSGGPTATPPVRVRCALARWLPVHSSSLFLFCSLCVSLRPACVL